MTKSCFAASTPSLAASSVAKVNVAAVASDWALSASSVLGTRPAISTTAQVMNGITSKMIKSSVATQKAKETAVKWHDIAKAELTPEIKAELTALRLKAFMDPKKFYKSSDLKKTPERFHFGVVVDGGLRAVGGGQESQAAGTANRTSAKGKSLLQEALGDEAVQAWTKKRFNTVHARQMKTAALSRKFKPKRLTKK